MAVDLLVRSPISDTYCLSVPRLLFSGKDGALTFDGFKRSL